MVKALTKHGNSYAVVIDRPIMELLKLDPDSKLEVTTDGKSLKLTPLSEAEVDEKVKQARKHVNAKYAKVLKRLAE